ncbi:hypothetical protein HGRIS_011110 [Hohenbuehelia grisea]|uniref:Homeobox domain-containing protein n=1 Tax=Hohenbuehelia grisea TaxID=104357 RepID=A0ABR3IZN2_9AGAR
MSNSRSATPTPRTPPANTTPRLAPALSISRPDTHDSLSFLRSRETDQDQSTPTPSSSIPLPQTGAEPSSSSLRRRAESLSDERSPKRRKTASEMRPRSHTRSSPSSDSPSDSQDGLADNENSPVIHQTEPQAVPPKKKRTRTLTTPHQSAVLHALLAQSRFPTTAMREEVGRSIGLSARKVQIWFQNQRQKMRRPRSQSDVASTRSSQFGPYTDPTSPTASSQYFHAFESAGADYGHLPPEQREALERRAGSGIFHISDPPQAGARPLLGPGVPGGDLLSRQSPALSPLSVYQSQHAHSTRSLPYERHSLPDVLQRRPTTAGASFPHMHRPTSQQSNPEAQRQGFSRTLPPLVSGALPRSSTPSMPPVAGSSRVLPPLTHSAPSSSGGPRSPSPSPETPFAHHSFESRGAPGMPPPFTMQPPPQWDPVALAQLPRPSWSRPGSHGSGDFPAYATRVGDNRGSADRSAHSPQPLAPRREPSPHTARSGRYDPIRDNNS